MIDPEVYLEKLTAFSRILRREGLSVSPRETGDSAAVLITLGLEDREQVKTALRTVFAKSRQEQGIFDRAFDSFFLTEEQIREQAKESARQLAEQEQRRQEAQEDLDHFGDPVSLTERQKQTYAEMPEEVREKLRKFMDKYKGTAERNPKLYGDFIHSVFAKTLMEQQMMMEDAGVGCDAADPEIVVMYRELSQFHDQEIPKAIDMIKKIARQINGELCARQKAAGHTGKLDFRRTIRKGLETGGSFYRLSYRKKPQRKRQLVLLCDVIRLHDAVFRVCSAVYSILESGIRQLQNLPFFRGTGGGRCL